MPGFASPRKNRATHKRTRPVRAEGATGVAAKRSERRVGQKVCGPSNRLTLETFALHWPPARSGVAPALPRQPALESCEPFVEELRTTESNCKRTIVSQRAWSFSGRAGIAP